MLYPTMVLVNIETAEAYNIFWLNRVFIFINFTSWPDRRPVLTMNIYADIFDPGSWKLE